MFSLKKVLVRAYNFFLFWICFILTNTQLNYAVTYLLFNCMFQSYLCSICRVRNASDADISVIFS
jgi:hypothetical protein